MSKTFAIILGVVFVLVGILGFFPNPLVGAQGLFVTNTLYELIYVLVGLVLLIVAFWAPARSALWLKIIGVIYLLLAVLGFLVIPGGGSLLGLSMNAADHWLNIVLGIVLIAAGFAPVTELDIRHISPSDGMGM